RIGIPPPQPRRVSLGAGGLARASSLCPPYKTVCTIHSGDRTCARAASMIFLQATDQPINSIAFSPDGATLAAASPGRIVPLWDTMAGTVRTVFTNPAGTGFQRVAFLPDG